MAYASNPLRNQAEEFIRSEIARLGPDGLDKGAIARRYVERGASKTRVHEWIKALVFDAKNPPLDRAEADMAVAEAMIAAAETAKVLDSLPGAADLARAQKAVQEVIKRPVYAARAAYHPSPASEPVGSAPWVAGLPATLDGSLCVVPGGASRIREHLQTIIDTIGRVIAHCHSADGKIRNPRMALAAVNRLRASLETALKLHEVIHNIELVERCMNQMLDEVRQVDRALAEAVVVRVRAAFRERWAV